MARPNNPARPKAVMKPEQVREIRAIGFRLTARQLGQRYGVQHRTFGKIPACKTWRALECAQHNRHRNS